MILIFYLICLTVLFFYINKFFIEKNILISETGDKHQKFASISKIPLTGGILLFLGFSSFINESILSLIFFSLLIIILGICSDLKLIESAFKRFLFQISIVLSFVILNNIQLLDTRIDILDQILEIKFINFLFVSFCILIVLNGSNFIDGLNTLNIGYFFVVIIILLILLTDEKIFYNEFALSYFAIFVFFIFLLNFFNRIFLGDSGSYLFGFIFSVLLIDIYNLNLNLSPFFIILLLWYPCYETLFSIIRKNIFNRSPMNPDSNHLHQLVFFYLKKKFKLKILYSNVLSANIINIYNFVVFFGALKFISHSLTLIFLILLNLAVYTVIYFKLFNFKNLRK